MKIYISQKNKLYIFCVFHMLSIFDNFGQICPGGLHADPRRTPGGPRGNFPDFGQKCVHFTTFFRKNNIKSKRVQTHIFLNINIQGSPSGGKSGISGKFREIWLSGVSPEVILHVQCETNAFYAINSDTFSGIWSKLVKIGQKLPKLCKLTTLAQNAHFAFFGDFPGK